MTIRRRGAMAHRVRTGRVNARVRCLMGFVIRTAAAGGYSSVWSLVQLRKSLHLFRQHCLAQQYGIFKTVQNEREASMSLGSPTKVQYSLKLTSNKETAVRLVWFGLVGLV